MHDSGAVKRTFPWYDDIHPRILGIFSESELLVALWNKAQLCYRKKRLKYPFYEKLGFPSVVNGVAPECISTLASQTVTAALLAPQLRGARFCKYLLNHAMSMSMSISTFVKCSCSAVCVAKVQCFSRVKWGVKITSVAVGITRKRFQISIHTLVVIYTKTHAKTHICLIITVTHKHTQRKEVTIHTESWWHAYTTWHHWAVIL